MHSKIRVLLCYYLKYHFKQLGNLNSIYEHLGE